MRLGPLTAAVADATREAMSAVPRLWDRDHRLWQEDPTEVADRLGWLDAPARATELVPRLERLAADVVADGVTDVLLVGMGGSSLYPEVLGTTFGSQDGGMRLHVLDSTDPGAVLAVEDALPWDRTLLVPASKSGTTIEMACHLERFLVRLHEAHGDDAGRFVTPITDPGSELDERAASDGYRRVFHGQPDVGGRFSALTPFGLWPAALLGLDVREHVGPASKELEAARTTDPADNAPATLGAVVLTTGSTAGFITLFAGVTLQGEPTPAEFPTEAGGWEAAIFYACYLPLLLWGPLLAAVAYAYHRRRRSS
jgi:transaldolase / glucose-6-phosphate isomerase